MYARSTPGRTTCLTALIVVVVVVVTVPLPIEATCAVYVRNTPWELHVASDLQVVCTATHVVNSAGSSAQANMSLRKFVITCHGKQGF